jgi:hypothetical protein
VGAASIREAVTVGGNVRLTSGKETESISALWSVRCSKKVGGHYKYHKLNLSSSIGVYYRIENSHCLRYDIVLSFDYLGARAPKSLPILFYGLVNMLEIWEKLEADEEDDSE